MGRLPEFVLAEVPGGLTALVPTTDYVGRAMFAIGDLDRKVSRTLQQFVGKGERVVDIGANLGLCTLQMATLVGPTGEVMAFEPNPDMVALLTRSIEFNRVVNVKVHACALGPSEGVADLGVPSTHAGKASLVVSAGGDVRSVSVPVRSLDSIIQNDGRRLGFVKMDVEGFEDQVLRGAVVLLERCPPEAWIFELHEMPAVPHHSTLIATFSDAGYELFSITASGFRIRYVRVPKHGPFERPPGHDVLAVHRDSTKMRHPALQVNR
jgi:FkbM family methyltransferase